MKIMTVLGTRPEIIRLCRVIDQLDRHCQHVLVHTGQNFDDRLSAIFFEQMGIRKPDHYLGVTADNAGTQIGKILIETERIITAEKPDGFLVLGDTNSGLSSIIARRKHLPVFHMEAGNRCYDLRVPEEVNRKIIDHSSTILLPYTHRSKENLLGEGIAGNSIYVTGNPIFEVLEHYSTQIAGSTVLKSLKLTPGKYFLVTMHREENVDNKARLSSIITGLGKLHDIYKLPVICSVHPRTRKMLSKYKISARRPGIIFSEPFGFFDFITLEKKARCLITDSGTVQEECCIFKIPNVTIRDVTERPETIECGSNILAGVEPGNIVKSVEVALSRKCDWTPPAEYLEKDVAAKVVSIVLGYFSGKSK